MGRLMGLLALLNVVVLVAGLSMEQVRAKPATLLDFNADKVRLLGRVELPEAPSASLADPVEPAAPPRKPVSRCLSWPELDRELLGEIESRMESAGIAVSDYDMSLGKRLGWWVYLPPFVDAEAMRAAIEAASRKGVKDIAPVRGGELRNAVSLGAFPSLGKARAQEKKLRSLGLEGMQIGPRPNSGHATLVIAAAVAETRLAGLDEGWGKGRAPLACAGD
ncbi:MAG: SPOR domain-containing protein [Pseudomonadota bacterium]|nr:SPOR domain-containing protein [Pseudomonadota bacterium]